MAEEAFIASNVLGQWLADMVASPGGGVHRLTFYFLPALCKISSRGGPRDRPGEKHNNRGDD
jgi:hypothetical protein